MDDAALQNYMHQWLQSKESNFFLAGIHTLVQRCRKIVVKCVDTMLKNNYTFSTVVVNFYGMFMIVTFKQQEIEDRKHLLSNLHILMHSVMLIFMCQHTTCTYKILIAYVNLKISTFVFILRGSINRLCLTVVYNSFVQYLYLCPDTKS
jgi:hypothetical protein